MKTLVEHNALRNRYFLMRHGQSRANVEHTIVSLPINAQNTYGLTDQGRQQVVKAGQRSKLTSATIIYTSDYARAKETAETIQRVLGVPVIHFSPCLRERNFGDWEGTSTDNYRLVWQNDGQGIYSNSVESPVEVLARTTKLIFELEEQHSGRDILLVSHGDTLQILQCGFCGIHPNAHRSLPHLELGEIRAANVL